MITTYTTSQTSTFSEARARTVMLQVLGDFMLVPSAGLISRGTIQEWHEELEYAVLLHVVDTVQLQFTKPDSTRLGLSYTVRDDGTILEASKAGGLDLYGFPRGTRVGLVLTYRQQAPNIETVKAYLRDRGWMRGSLIDGVTRRDRAFSKDGFGIARGKVGEWG